MLKENVSTLPILVEQFRLPDPDYIAAYVVNFIFKANPRFVHPFDVAKWFGISDGEVDKERAHSLILEQLRSDHEKKAAYARSAENILPIIRKAVKLAYKNVMGFPPLTFPASVEIISPWESLYRGLTSLEKNPIEVSFWRIKCNYSFNGKTQRIEYWPDERDEGILIPALVEETIHSHGYHENFNWGDRIYQREGLLINVEHNRQSRMVGWAEEAVVAILVQEVQRLFSLSSITAGYHLEREALNIITGKNLCDLVRVHSRPGITVVLQQLQSALSEDVLKLLTSPEINQRAWFNDRSLLDDLIKAKCGDAG